MIGKPQISLRGLRTFCVAARYESFRTAGEELFITASAVSHQIKSLEEELGQQLFERGSRELKLTGVASSSVRISVQPFFGSEFFVPRLSEFTAEHPEIDIQVGSSDESTEKHPSDADMSIRLFRTPPSNLPSSLLFPLRMVPAGSPDFKDAMEVKKKKIVSEFPIIVHETHPKAWAQWASTAGIELPKKNKIIRLDSTIAVLRAAQRGIGAALVPVPMGNLWLKEGSIVRLFRKEFVADVSYYLVCKEDRAADKSVMLLRDWILQNFADRG